MDFSHEETEVKRPQSSSSNWSWEMVAMEDQENEQGELAQKHEKYPAKHHARAVAKQLGIKDGLIYLPGMPELGYEDSDNTIEFRQRRYFYYLSGLDIPDCTVTYDLRFDKLYAWIPPARTVREVIYLGQNPSPEDVKEIAHFDGVAYADELEDYMWRFSQERTGKIFLLHPNQVPRSLATQASNLSLERGKTLFDVTSLLPSMNIARSFKSSYEISLIRKANGITTQAHINVLQSIRSLKNEAEIEAIFLATCIKTQAKRQAYAPIAGSGTNASVLHYSANNQSLQGRQLVCLDAGCEWKLYASDVTRTFPISGKWTKEAKTIYDIVERMQDECIGMVKPGASYRDIHLHAHRVAAEGLLKIGVLRGDLDELIDARATAPFFPHGLGHYVGLEVHDVGEGGTLRWSIEQSKHKTWNAAFDAMIEHPMLSAASILQANQVITIEPGIYFSQYALEEVYLKDERFSKYINQDVLKTYYPVGGVRIEDDILVTKDGYENLTTAPKGEDALRIIDGRGERLGLDYP